MSFLLEIATANPAHKHLQDVVADFYSNTIQDDEHTSRKIKLIGKKSGIMQRFSVLEDFSLPSNNFLFFPKNPGLEPVPGLNERMRIFKKEAVALSAAAIHKLRHFEKIKDRITHIITVTCTGLFAPGLDIELMEVLRMKNDIQRSSINFMGCNAAILALKQADHICRAEKKALVLIVCTELCTLHFQKAYTDDYILSNMLFGDGAAAALISSKSDIHSDYRPLEINSFHSLIIHEGYNDMAWQISESGFIMNLTSYVSGILNKNIKSLLAEAGVDGKKIDRWAIHPGGKKILDDFCQVMDLKKEEIADSYSILQNYGNMSSATILFVLQILMQKPDKGSTIYAAAFGPGLSIESAFFKYV